MLRFIVLVLLASGVCSRKRYDGHKLVSVFTRDDHDAQLLYSLERNFSFDGIDFWTQPSRVRPTDIRVSPNDFVELREVLQKAGVDFSVTRENLQIDIDIEDESLRRARARNIGDSCDFYNSYCSYDEIVELLKNWEEKNPINVKLHSIGMSHENRTIYMIDIYGATEYKPAIIVEAGTHAREWITVSSALALIDRLMSGSPEAQIMLSTYDWFIVPLHNPDGYEYSRYADRYWRKNRSPCDGSEVGIDLNRNWNVDFCATGASDSCRSNLYCGRYPFEAPETRALADSLESIRSHTNVTAFFSIHCYSQMMLVPYGFTSLKPGNYDKLKTVADIMMQALYDVNGRLFEVGTPPDILYPASGGAYDYFFLHGVPWSYTYELRPEPGHGLAGFALPPDQIRDATDEFFASMFAFASLDLSEIMI